MSFLFVYLTVLTASGVTLANSSTTRLLSSLGNPLHHLRRSTMRMCPQHTTLQNNLALHYIGEGHAT